MIVKVSFFTKKIYKMHYTDKIIRYVGGWIVWILKGRKTDIEFETECLKPSYKCTRNFIIGISFFFFLFVIVSLLFPSFVLLK